MLQRIVLILSVLTLCASANAGIGDFDAAASIASRGFLLTWIVVFFAGVLVSFTPCVYPMIPITLSIIGARNAQQRPLQGFLRSLVFVLGLALVYTALGFAGAKTGKLVGFMLQSKWFLGFLTLFFIAMGASMLGLFEIQLPPSIASRLQGKAGRGGYVGAFLLGVVTGVVASPCGSPVLFSVLTLAAQSGQEIVGMLLLFAYALGIGMLFLFLGTFPSFLQAMPRSGDWMEDVRIFLGLVLLAVAIGYYAGFLFTPAVHGAIVALSSVAAVVFCLKHARNRSQQRGLWTFWLAMALVLLGCAAYGGWGIYRSLTTSQKDLGTVGAATPEKPVQKVAPAATSETLPGVTEKQTSAPAGELPAVQTVAKAAATEGWLASESDALRKAKEEGKPVIIDFGAAWCAACKELEHKTFSDPEVARILDGFVKVRIDCTEETDENSALRQKYGAISLPTVVLVKPDGTVAAELTLRKFEEPTKFVERLNRFLGRGAGGK